MTLTARDLGDLYGRRVALTGKPGSGKTTTLGNLVLRHPRSVGLDPVGKLAPWFDVQVKVRDYGTQMDHVVEEATRKVAESWHDLESVCFDLSGIGPDTRGRFIDAFGYAALRHLRQGLVVIDESHYMYQSGTFSSNLGRYEMVGQSRNHQLGILFSQHRIAQVDNNVLELADLWLIMNLTGARDLDAVEEYLSVHADRSELKQLRRDVANLPTGGMVVWDTSL